MIQIINCGAVRFSADASARLTRDGKVCGALTLQIIGCLIIRLFFFSSRTIMPVAPLRYLVCFNASAPTPGTTQFAPVPKHTDACATRRRSKILDRLQAANEFRMVRA